MKERATSLRRSRKRVETLRRQAERAKTGVQPFLGNFEVTIEPAPGFVVPDTQLPPRPARRRGRITFGGVTGEALDKKS